VFKERAPSPGAIVFKERAPSPGAIVFKERAPSPGAIVDGIHAARGSPLGLELIDGGLRPLHQKSACLAQSILGPYVVEQIWSRNNPESGPHKAFTIRPQRKLHSTVWYTHVQGCLGHKKLPPLL
jgi:hypothetical protein